MSHFGSWGRRFVCSGQIRGSKALIQDGADGVFDTSCFAFQLKRMTQQQGRGKNCAEGIGNSLAGDVGRGSMDWLVHADWAADAGRGQQAQRAYYSAGLVGENVAEHVLGEEHIEIFGALDQRHGGGIYVHVRELDAGIILGAAGYDFSPQAGTLQHIGFVDGENFLAALGCEVEGYASDALDGGFAVRHGVRGYAGTGRAGDGTRFSEIEPSEQLADDHDVGAAN